MRWLALIAIATAVASAAPQVHLHAHSQLALQRVKKLDEGRVEISGQLVDKLTGDALANQRIIIKVGEFQTYGFTEADGSFRATVPAEDGPVAVELAYGGTDKVEAAVPLQVSMDPAKAQVELSIAKLAETPTGVAVKVIASGDEGPLQLSVQLAIAEVRPNERDAPEPTFRPLRAIDTNRDLEITRREAGAPGLYRLSAKFAGDDLRQSASAELTLELASATTTTMSLKSTSLAFEDSLVATGRVADDDGKPVHAAVTLSAGDKRLAQGATEPDGSYRFKVEAELLGQGAYTIQVASDPGSPSVRSSRSEPVQIKIAAPAPVPVSYTIAAFLATALAAGGFFAARTKPWRRLRRPAPPADVPGVEAEVEVGRGGLVVAKPGLVSTLRRATDDGFSGVVRDSVRGRPVAQAIVHVTASDGDHDVHTGADGSFAFEHLPGGDWQAEVSALGHITEKFVVSIPHRGELRGVRVDLVPVRERVFQLYRRAAEPVLPEPRLWGVWSPRQIVDHVRDKRPSPALAELTDFVEEVYFSPRLVAETVLPQASERVDRAIQERVWLSR